MKKEFSIHPILSYERTLSQKSADIIASWTGSWTFIIIYTVLITVYILINIYAWLNVWDPYPFILLNLILACITALQAPIILMSQNRQAQKDRLRAEYDHSINIKSEKEIGEIKQQLNRIERRLR